MPRYINESDFVDETGWGRWVMPVKSPKVYKMMCCDCGLVHDLEFKIDEDGDIIFRVRRNNRSTGQARRHMKNHAK